MKVALVHDWLTGMRGGERVLHELCHIFPGAPIFTLFHRPGSVGRRIESMRIEPSLLNRLPGVTRYYQHLLPLLPWAVSRFDLRGFDLIVSVSHAVAKGVRKPRGAMHICYCLTPMRYIWDMQADYFRYSDAFGIRESLLRVMTPALRSWDKATALDVDHFIADSKHVQGRIFKCYGRESDLIYPPVDTGFFTPSDNPRHDGFYL